MRRQTKPQGLAARWHVRPLDVDPFHLPARYALPVCSATGGQAEDLDTIVITPEQVAIERRMKAGKRLEMLKVRDFRGVAVRIAGTESEAGSFAISVNLHHDEPDLCVPLHMAFDLCDAGARWQSWGRTLKLPLLMPTEDGEWREPAEVPGTLFFRAPTPRHPRLALAGRRSRMSAVREVGHCDRLAIIAGTEIIARS